MNLTSIDITKLGNYSLAAIALFILGYVLIIVIKKVNFGKGTNGYATKENLESHHEYVREKLNEIINRNDKLESELYDLHEKEFEQYDYLVKEIMALTSLIKELLIYFKSYIQNK